MSQAAVITVLVCLKHNPSRSGHATNTHTFLYSCRLQPCTVIPTVETIETLLRENIPVRYRVTLSLERTRCRS